MRLETQKCYSYLLKKLHILPTCSTLAIPQKSMCSRRVVNDNVKDLCTEKVGCIKSVSRPSQSRILATAASVFHLMCLEIHAGHCIRFCHGGVFSTARVSSMRITSSVGKIRSWARVGLGLRSGRGGYRTERRGSVDADI